MEELKINGLTVSGFDSDKDVNIYTEMNKDYPSEYDQYFNVDQVRQLHTFLTEQLKKIDDDRK